MGNGTFSIQKVEFTRGSVRVDGAQIEYEIAGEPPWLVLIHGGLVHMGLWDDQLVDFGRRRGILRYDQRGFVRPVTERKSFRHIDDLFALLDRLGIESAVLVGLPQGGRIAVEAALEAPERVEALVLTGPGVQGFDWAPEVQAHSSQIGAAFERGDAELAIELCHRMWTDGPRRQPEDVHRATRERLKQMSREAFAGTDTDEDESPTLPAAIGRFGELSMPVLLIEGEFDQPDIHRIGDAIAANAPDVERHRIADTAHHPNVERPEQFNSLVLDWLARRELV